MKETFGLINAKNAKPPSPKASPKDFVWPPQDHDDKIAQKFAASLQELLPKREWKHTHLAHALWGGIGPKDAPRNVAAPRRWVLAEHPIPNEETASYIAEVLGVSLARLLEPEGRFDPLPAMVRPRSDSPRFAGKAKAKAKKKTKMAGSAGTTPSGKDREKQRRYNEAYRARKKAEKTGKVKRQYTKRPKSNGGEDNGAWVLADGVEPPTYQISSAEDHAGHVELELKGTMPHSRAMAILHILQHEESNE